jgi:hypothetical protein
MMHERIKRDLAALAKERCGKPYSELYEAMVGLIEKGLIRDSGRLRRGQIVWVAVEPEKLGVGR